MNSGKVVLGALGGLAAGALLGILFAPEKGSDTRKKISKKSKNYLGKVKGKFDDLIDNLSDTIEEMKGKVSEFTEKTKAAAKEASAGNPSS